MHRQHYRNNFIQGETTFQQQQRNTRSNNTQVQQAAVPSPAVIPIKTESAPPQQPTPQVVQQPIAAVVQQPAPTPMKVDPPTKAADISLSEDDLMKLKKINFKKKVTGKEKRLKQNKKLFRMLTPRNAIAALNELHGQSINETTVVPVPGNKFEAEIVINNVKFQGLGNSKMAAKNSACEKALRDLVINKFKQIKHTDIQLPITEDVNMEEGSDTSGDVPMLQLASFALHKLFSEWESEGFEIPFPKVNPEVAPVPSTPPNGLEAKASPKAPKVRNELPPNNLQIHPVMLLSVMRPCTQYSDLGSQGVTPNILHTVGCTVDNQSFIGQGRSKKEARKRVATEILIKLFEWKGSCC